MVIRGLFLRGGDGIDFLMGLDGEVGFVVVRIWGSGFL